MDDRSFNMRVPKRWVHVAMIVGVTALIVAPLTAIATDIFTDVPASNTFHGDIAAIADAGVTKGCNPPDNTEYCPDDNVTRGQMAAFMNRLGALDPGKTPVANAATAVEADHADTADNATNADNADKVDGQDASDFLGATDKAADSDLLDGKDATAFENIFAVISLNLGELSVLSDNGLNSAVKNSTGNYTLTFDRAVDDCAWLATIGARNGGTSAGTRTITLNGGGTTAPEDISVHTELNGGDTDSSFNIGVLCG